VSYRAFLLAPFVLAATAAGALAADEGGDVNILAPRFDLTLWSIVVFVILFLVLRKFAWGPILQGLTKREKSIEEAIEEAKRAREEMAKHKADFDRQLADANQQIPKLMEEARKAADQLREEMRNQANAEITSERQRMRREIEVARDQALQDIWTQAANLATLISSQVVGRALSADDHRRLVDDALKEIEGIAERGQGVRAAEAGAAWVRQAGGKI
jgi:F-type H+-transporting ATPase subunit b